MEQGTLAEALEREHHEIDEGIEDYLAGLDVGETRLESLQRAIAALRRHIHLEETYLFPPLRDSLYAPIFVMLREHGEVWRTLDAVEALLRGDAPPAAMTDICRVLLVQLEQHNAKEEPLLYPPADTELDPAAREGLQRFIEAGRMPEGWVCTTADVATAELFSDV